MQDIKELTLRELEVRLKKWDESVFHGRQIFSWIYQKGIRDFELMSDLPINLRKRLSEDFYITGLRLIKTLESRDSTKKLLFSLKDKNLIEAVVIPAVNRITGCISTQVGCKFHCQFCTSGMSGFKRNLSVGEILDEVLFLKQITHLVFMGIGEPLDNYNNLLRAIRIINSKNSFNIGARRITISTSGVIPGIVRLMQENLQLELYDYLHSADNKTRSQIMPINKIYPLGELIPACRKYIAKTNRQITFEYILIKGLNSDLQSALNLVKILQGLNCKVNLIPVNPVKKKNIEPPKKIEILILRDYLLKHGLKATLRKPRGEDIEAACGQLRLRYEK